MDLADSDQLGLDAYSRTVSGVAAALLPRVAPGAARLGDADGLAGSVTAGS